MPVSLPVGEQFKSHAPGELRVSYGLTYSDADHYYIGADRDDGAGGVEETVAPATLGIENVLALEYDLAHGITMGLEIPLVHTEQSREFGGVKGNMKASGLGDVRVLGRYWLRDQATGVRIYGAAGLRLPTGESDKQFQAQNGRMITQDLAAQAGTGNLAGIAEFGGSTLLGQRVGVALSARYIFTPSATTVNNFRNELTGNGPEKNSDSDALAARLSISAPLSTGGGVLGQFAARAIFDFAWVPYDDLFGETEGFRRAGPIFLIGPGLSYAPTQSFSFSAAVPFTVYRDVQQNGGNVQEWTFQFGLSFNAITPGEY